MMKVLKLLCFFIVVTSAKLEIKKYKRGVLLGNNDLLQPFPIGNGLLPVPVQPVIPAFHTIAKHVPLVVPVEKHVHVPVKVPVAVPVDRPVAVPVDRPVPYPVHVIKHVAVPVLRHVPVPVDRPVAVPVPHAVPVPVPVHHPVPVPVPQPYPVVVQKEAAAPPAALLPNQFPLQLFPASNTRHLPNSLPVPQYTAKDLPHAHGPSSFLLQQSVHGNYDDVRPVHENHDLPHSHYYKKNLYHRVHAAPILSPRLPHVVHRSW